MSEPAAFQATFADFRLVKGRKVAQFVVEVPLEAADHALAMLGGLPQPDTDRWVAVARLNPSPGVPVVGSDGTDEPRVAPLTTADGSAPGETKVYTLANKIGMRCNDKQFQRWIAVREEAEPSDFDATAAAGYVRRYCGVRSRAEITPDSEAAILWSVLETEFMRDNGMMAEPR